VSQTLLEQIVAATAGEYTIIGPLGETPGSAAFLAREVATDGLVVLLLAADAEELVVLAALGSEVPANAGRCTECDQAPTGWSADCPHCGRPFVLPAVTAYGFTLDDVRAAAAHAYYVEGEVPHLGGGSLFFVRDQVDGRLVALAAQTDADGAHVLRAVWTAAAPPAAAAYGAGDPAARSDAGAGEPAYAGAFAAPAADAWSPEAAHAEPALLGADTAWGASAPPSDMPPTMAPAPRRRRRRWMPVAAVAALVAAGGAWALWAGREVPPERTLLAADSVVPTPPLPDSAALGALGGVAATGPDTTTATATATTATTESGTIDRTATPGDSAPAARRTRPRPAPATLILDGTLPAGWTLVIDGRPAPASANVQLPARRNVVVQVSAPGYCPETFRVSAPEPGATVSWSPRLRGQPMVGEC
jgi:hypothetical protein